MKELFLPYDLSLELRELSFDKPCFMQWYDNKLRGDKFHYNTSTLNAPLYQQAFKFFREKYQLYHHIFPEFYDDNINFNWQILWKNGGTFLYGDNGEYSTYEEAEIECIKKLIELVKQNGKRI